MRISMALGVAFLHTVGLACAAAAQAAAPAAPAAPTLRGAPAAASAELHSAPATEWCPISKVVDGDTIWVQRKGAEEKLRLMCVDTEEKFHGAAFDPGKPETVFGQETALWAQQFFAGLAKDGQPTSIGLLFPDGREQRDVFGRLLCHVILPDGTDYQLKLVREGKSPYFNKYGNSQHFHAAFAAAQAAARREQLGIWNPATNAPQTAGQPSAVRPYARLLPWWDARAAAIEGFQARKAKGEAGLYEAEIPSEVAAALASAAKDGKPVTFFGTPDAPHDEEDGSVTWVLRGSDKKQLVRLSVPKSALERMSALPLKSYSEEYHQNYLYVSGRIQPNPARGGALLELSDPKQLSFAEPAYSEGAAPKPKG